MKAHLSKATSGLPQKCTQFMTPFLCTVFQDLSLYVSLICLLDNFRCQKVVSVTNTQNIMGHTI